MVPSLGMHGSNLAQQARHIVDSFTGNWAMDRVAIESSMERLEAVISDCQQVHFAAPTNVHVAVRDTSVHCPGLPPLSEFFACTICPPVCTP